MITTWFESWLVCCFFSFDDELTDEAGEDGTEYESANCGDIELLVEEFVIFIRLFWWTDEDEDEEEYSDKWSDLGEFCWRFVSIFNWLSLLVGVVSTGSKDGSLGGGGAGAFFFVEFNNFVISSSNFGGTGGGGAGAFFLDVIILDGIITSWLILLLIDCIWTFSSRWCLLDSFSNFLLLRLNKPNIVDELVFIGVASDSLVKSISDFDLSNNMSLFLFVAEKLFWYIFLDWTLDFVLFWVNIE